MMSFLRGIFRRKRKVAPRELECWLALVPVEDELRPSPVFIGPSANSVRLQVGRIFAVTGETEEEGWKEAEGIGWRITRAALTLQETA
jgi:hypothetical protein